MPISLIEALNRLAAKRNLPAAHEILQRNSQREADAAFQALPWWVKC